MTTTPLALLGFGFLLGIRHALDVDHLAAVSTIVSQRRGVWGSSLVGALWGLGHTASLLAVAVVVIALHTEIPPRVALLLEAGVAAMLIGLGVNLLWTLVRGGGLHGHVHAHDRHTHRHLHVHRAGEVGTHRHARRPFVVGLVHGLAGSAGLMLAVAASIPSSVVALAYVAVFGVGSIGGMAIMSALLGAPLAMASDRIPGAEPALRAAAAVGSVVIGVLLAWELGVQARALL